MKKIVCTLITLFSLSLSAQIDRMEPPFWYEGMNKSEVQVLFYGKNIAQNSVQVSNDVVITNVTKTENPNYLFVTIDTKNVKAQNLEFTLTNGIILLSTLLTAFIIPSFFSLENYGYYKLFTLFISFYGIFHFGFIDGIYLKYAGLNYSELNKDLFRTFSFFLFISQTFMALLLMIVTLTIFQNGQILFYIFISIDLVLTNLIFYFQYVSQMTKKFSVNITASSIQAALNLILVSFLFIFKQDNYLFFISFILVINIITIIYYLISFKEISFFNFSISQLLDIEIILHIKEIIKIGIPFLLSNLFTVLIFNFSRLFISFIYNNEKFALFSFSFTIITFIQYVLLSVNSVIFPYLKNLNFDLLKSNYSKIVSIIQFLSSYLLLLFFRFLFS
jgi:O-antigen/teichoic acid export membrane protein